LAEGFVELFITLVVLRIRAAGALGRDWFEKRIDIHGAAEVTWLGRV
jgi:hypothetical protein